MRRNLSAAGLLAVAALFSNVAYTDAVEESLIDGLEYRLIGPWRGGPTPTARCWTWKAHCWSTSVTPIASGSHASLHRFGRGGMFH